MTCATPSAASLVGVGISAAVEAVVLLICSVEGWDRCGSREHHRSAVSSRKSNFALASRRQFATVRCCSGGVPAGTENLHSVLAALRHFRSCLSLNRSFAVYYWHLMCS